MSKRLQVVMDDSEYQEIQDAAAALRLTTSAWVRQVLRNAREAGEGRTAPAAPPVAPGTPPLPPPAPAGPAASPVGELSAALGSGALALVQAGMERHGLPNAQEAIRYALRRAAAPPMLREEMLELRGTGWAGDLDTIR